MEKNYLRTAQLLMERKGFIVKVAAEMHLEAQPHWLQTYGERAKVNTVKDYSYHLEYLINSIQLNSISIYADYLSWCKVFFNSIKLPENTLEDSLKYLLVVLKNNLQDEYYFTAEEYINKSLQELNFRPKSLPAFIDVHTKYGVLAHQYINALLRGDRNIARELVLNEVKSGTPVKEIYLNVFQVSQHEIGRLWQHNEISVALEHFCTAATQSIMSLMYPYIFSSEKKGRVMVSTCVSGELHELGIRMVSDFFEMDGWDTYYLGANTPTKDIIGLIIDKKAQLLAISSTLSIHLGYVKNLIDEVKANPKTKDLKILVGGHPFTNDNSLWLKVGADAFAENATIAVETANSFYN